MQHNKYPMWKELYGSFIQNFLDSYNWEKYELILFKNDYSVLFYGKYCQLMAQEYKFLKNILNQGNRKISADKLMRQIHSKCEDELRQKLSYRIKSKIKNKLKKNWNDYLPSYNQVEWMVLDNSYEHNECICISPDGSRHSQFQYCDFETAFNMLITVRDGFYYSEFRKK